VKWGAGDPSALGHVETEYLRFGTSEDEARDSLGAMRLTDALAELNRSLDLRAGPSRPWYDAMHDEEEG
jgi:hypothetical protein